MSARARRDSSSRRSDGRSAVDMRAAAGSDVHAASRAAHVSILRGIAVALVACEVIGHATGAPSVLRIGLSGALRLPYMAPALLGVFLAHVLLRPNRNERLATAALASLLFYPLFTFLAGEDFAAVRAAFDALGIGTLVVLVVQLRRSDRGERAAVLDVLLPALILPGFVLLTSPLLYMTALLWPTTYDPHLYLADAAFGRPLSFDIARTAGAVPGLIVVCLLVYVALPLALMLVHVLRYRQGMEARDTLVAFVAVTLVGYAGFLVVPVVGPVYAFGAVFPLEPPDPSSVAAVKRLAPPLPRNCMPSLHTAWALLIWWNSRALSRGPRIGFGLFFAFTLLATVALGFHYVVDLVAAFPLTMAVQAWATRVTDARTRRHAILLGAALTIGWIAVATWGTAWLLASPVVPALLAAAVVAASIQLERRIDRVAASKPPEPPAMGVRALLLSRRGSGATTGAPGGNPAPQSPTKIPAPALLAAVAFLAFVLPTGFEHLLASLGDSAYAYERTWVVWLLGLAAGTFVAPKLRAAQRDSVLPLAGLLCAAAVSVFVGRLLWEEIPAYFASYAGYTEQYGVAATFAERELVRLCVTALLVLPPALAVGGALGLLAEGIASRSDGTTTSVWIGIAAALAAGAAGALLAGLFLLPSFGSGILLELVAGGSLLIAVVLALCASGRR